MYNTIGHWINLHPEKSLIIQIKILKYILTCNFYSLINSLGLNGVKTYSYLLNGVKTNSYLINFKSNSGIKE